MRSRRQIRLGNNAIILSGSILNGRSSTESFGIECGDDLYVKENCYIDAYGGYIHVGRGMACAQGAAIHGNGGVRIGDYLMMGNGAMIVAGNHRFRLGERPFILQGSACEGITIGDNVWIGAHAIVLDKVTIGNNVVIGAGTVVARDIPDNYVATGSRDLTLTKIRMSPND